VASTSSRNTVNPVLIARLVRLGWGAAAFAAVIAAVVSILAVWLPDPVWFSLPVGKVSGGPAAFALGHTGLLIGAWVGVLVTAALVLLVRLLGRPDRPGLVVVLIVAIALGLVPFAALLGSVLPQAGAGAALTEAQTATWVVPMASLGAFVGTSLAVGGIIVIAVRSRR
jgi:hypothetical protein